MRITTLLLAGVLAIPLAAKTPPTEPDWRALEEETIRHFQALLRFDTSDPPGREQEAADYLKQVLEAEGIPVELYSLEPHRPNVVARLKGNGSRRPILLMGHTDVVNVDPKKWIHPPFAAVRDGGHIYGRGAVDDKDNVAAVLMAMLLLKRQNVPLDRDVIALFEAGEEGSTRVGIEFMVGRHFEAIDAEFCLAEGGNAMRVGGQVKFASVQTLEKIPRAIQLIARGPSGHGSIPLRGNAVVRLARAVARVGAWKAPIALNETTRTYFERLATISTPEEAARYRGILNPDPAVADPIDEHLLEHEPRHAAMIGTSISPTIIDAGYRINVIPGEVTATLDVRTMPDEDLDAFLAKLREVIGDPAVDVRWAERDVRPGGTSRLDTDAFKAIETLVRRHYDTVTLPTMSTGATDMAYLRAKGVQCYGIGPAVDIEDGPKGFGAHSDQERILESELHRFVRFQYDVVRRLAESSRQPQSPGLAF